MPAAKPPNRSSDRSNFLRRPYARNRPIELIISLQNMDGKGIDATLESLLAQPEKSVIVA